jgi:hypothetical protein
VNRDETMRALEELARSPAARWIGNKLLDGGTRLLQKCTRCGAEQVLEMPSVVVAAFQGGARGDALASRVPDDSDAKLYAWKRDFQIAHEGCSEPEDVLS